MSQLINLAEASAMTERHRHNREAILATQFQHKNILPICETFDRAVADRLLAQAGCTGLRIYYGMDEDLKLHAILVGVAEDGSDLLTGDDPNGPGNEDIIGENANRCPPLCPPPSPLNP